MRPEVSKATMPPRLPSLFPAESLATQNLRRLIARGVMMQELFFLLLIVTVATTAAHRQTQLRSVFEVFELETLSFERRDQSNDCFGAPYFYATFGHESAGVRKFSRNGCLISDNILQGGSVSDMDLRSMAIDNNGDLLVANAASGEGQILLYGTCHEAPIGQNTANHRPRNSQRVDARADEVAHGIAKGQRRFKGIAVDNRTSPGALDPYGIAVDANQARSSTPSHQHALRLSSCEPPPNAPGLLRMAMEKAGKPCPQPAHTDNKELCWEHDAWSNPGFHPAG